MNSKQTKKAQTNNQSSDVDDVVTKKRSNIMYNENLIKENLEEFELDFEREKNILKQLLQSDVNQFQINHVFHNLNDLKLKNNRAFQHLSLYYDENELRV